MAVKRRPVATVEIHPRQATTVKWRVSKLSFDEQTLPVINIPPKHSTTTCCGPGKIDPLRLAPIGLRMV